MYEICQEWCIMIKKWSLNDHIINFQISFNKYRVKEAVVSKWRKWESQILIKDDLLIPIKYPALVYIISNPPWWTVLFHFFREKSYGFKKVKEVPQGPSCTSETKYEAMILQCLYILFP